ncbi:MAG: DUF6015 family protein [Thermoplasmata archaeon]
MASPGRSMSKMPAATIGARGKRSASAELPSIGAPSPAEDTTTVIFDNFDGPGPVDFDSLTKAIRRSVGHDGMQSEDARTIANHVLNFFGFNERIIDNVLEPDDRDTFYMLEDNGILETERDETTLYDGREWRIHYWMFRKERIVELANQETEAMAAAGETDVTYSHVPRSSTYVLPHGEQGTGMADHAVYHELGDDIWLERRQKPAPEAPAADPGRTRPSSPK